MKKIKLDIDLKHTLDSGQLFRYKKEGEGYRILHSGNSFFVKENGENLLFEGVSSEKIKDFFRYDDPYEQILKEINKDDLMNKAINSYQGLRIMNQDPWECTISFVCSSATNIERIKRDLDNISEKFGEKEKYGYSFPSIGKLGNEEELRDCGTGYRAEYLEKINELVDKEYFKELESMSYKKAKNKLMNLPGIADKVSECILLFSLNHIKAFPVDSWIEKVMKENYLEEDSKPSEIRDFAQDYFGKYAGYAQQFLFHWRRKK